MIRTAQSVRMLQAVAVFAGLAVLLWSLGFLATRQADAANLVQVSDTLSDSKPGPTTSADHTIQFTIPAGSAGVDGSVAGSEDITVTFPTGFSLATTSLADIDLEIDTVDQPLVLSGGGANDWTVSTTSQVLTLTAGSGETVAANATVTIKIGSNATTGGAGSTVMRNPTATGSYQISLTAGANDSGTTHVVILEGVTVSATVDTVFTFSVNGRSAGGTVNGETITGNTTPSTIPFGTLTAGTPTTSAHLLTVTTNATYGYTVTVEQDTDLQSATGAIIDSFKDGSYLNTPTAWASPLGQVGTSTTWGHWGLTTEDYATGATNEFSATNQWVAASTTPRIIMGHTGPADGTTPGIGTTSVGYKVEITALQEAADDYETTLTYIATPTF